MRMLEDDARTLMSLVHGTFPTLAIATNSEVTNRWVAEFRHLNFGTTEEVIQDFIAGRTKIPNNKDAPALRDIISEVRRRISGAKARAQGERFRDVKAKPIRLDGFEDGDYVIVDPDLPGLWERFGSLPGGRIDKTAMFDMIAEIPVHMVKRMGLADGYYLMSTWITNPEHLRHVRLMNDEQRKNWIAEMDRLEADGRLSQFSKRRGD